MSYTSEHGRTNRGLKELRNDKGTLIQTQEEGPSVAKHQIFPGEGVRADGSLPKRDTKQDRDLDAAPGGNVTGTGLNNKDRVEGTTDEFHQPTITKHASEQYDTTDLHAQNDFESQMDKKQNEKEATIAVTGAKLDEPDVKETSTDRKNRILNEDLATSRESEIPL